MNLPGKNRGAERAGIRDASFKKRAVNEFFAIAGKKPHGYARFAVNDAASEKEARL